MDGTFDQTGEIRWMREAKGDKKRTAVSVPCTAETKGLELSNE